jgi:hypothetical protein
MKSFNQTLPYNALSQYIKDFELLLDYIYKFAPNHLTCIYGQELQAFETVS